MRPSLLIRTCAWILPLVLTLAAPNLASSQPAGSPDLAPGARERLSVAAADASLPAWQRDVMVRLAQGGTAVTLDSGTPDDPASAFAHLPAPLGAARAAQDGLPSARYAQGAIYDPVRDRMVVFGGWQSGENLNDVWALSLAGTPTWTELTPDGTPPSVRRYPGVIYDPVRDRMVMFGGFTGDVYLNDVWELSLAGTPTWTELTPSGTPPHARYRDSAIYDPLRDRMVVFAGWHSGMPFNDVWALSLAGTPAWTELTPLGTPPIGRYSPSAIYDPVRDRMVVFGGVEDRILDDVWELSLAGIPAWTELTPDGPLPRARHTHSAIYDPTRDRMVVFAGFDGAGYRNDTWELSLGDTLAWTELTPGGTPPNGRFGQSAIYDPLRDRVVVFAGYSEYGCYDDVWELALADPTTWTLLLAPDSLVLTVNATNGSVTQDPLPSGGKYARGTAVLLTATPDLGYHFVGYSGDAVVTTDTVTVLMFGDRTVTANFQAPTGVGGEVRPAVTLLLPARPNPFRQSATLAFSIARGGPVELTVYSVDGRRVRTLVREYREPGEYRATWDGRDEGGSPVSAGVYYARLETADRPLTRVMTHLK